jgi:CRP-like cAMP-binding protein
MQDYSPILKHIASFSETDQQLFVSVLKMTKVKRKQFLLHPGMISKDRSYIVEGSFKAFLIGRDGQEHTISLAIDDGWIGDPGSFVSQEPSTLSIEALEDSTLIQWSYESEQLLLGRIPQFVQVMMQRSQQIALTIQRRVISHLTLSAEERYNEFADKYPAYLQRFPLHVIASYLGMSREFLSKIRNQKVNTKNGSKNT